MESGNKRTIFIASHRGDGLEGLTLMTGRTTVMTCNLRAIATEVPVQTFRNERSNVELAKVVMLSAVSADIQDRDQYSTKDLATYGR